MIKGVIFDMDGVLFDTERLNAVLIRQAAKEQNALVTDETFNAMLGVNLVTSRQIMLAAHPWVDYDVMISRWNALMFEHVAAHGMPLKAGVPEVLYRLKKKGIKIGLATSTDRDCVTVYFKAAGLENVFNALACGKEVPNGKPAPDIYLHCAKQLGVAPEECIGVEDSLNGVKAVRAAGMVCVMVPDIIPYGEQHALYVDKVLTDLNALEALI